MRRILFVCLGNICWSPMAEVLLREALQKDPKLRGERIEIRSAGTSGWDRAPATALAVEVMERRGLDLLGHQGRRLTRELVDWADLVLAMEGRQRDWILRCYPDAAANVFTLAEYAGDEADYARCADRLSALIPELLARLRREIASPRTV